MKLRLLALCTTVGIVGSQTALAQQSAPELLSIVGAPFSGDRVWQGARNFVDGNRVDRGSVIHMYRDGQGRTRVERELPAQALERNPRMDAVQVTINDPVSGDRVELHAKTKTAIIFRGGSARALPQPTKPIGVSVTFAGHAYPAVDPGWSKPVALGEKSFDNLRATGQRWKYTIPVGAFGNEKPVQLTVDQWFSPELSLVVAKHGTSSLGGEFSNEVENIKRGEPSPALFQIPSDYTRVEAPRRQAAIR